MQIISKNLSPEDNFCNAIVMQAVQDYREARKSPKDYAMISDCERFFKSEWFKALTKVDPDYLLEKLKEEDEDDA